MTRLADGHGTGMHRLLDVRVPPKARAVAIVLHGGGGRPGGPEVSPAQLSVLRMVPVARRVARAGRGQLAVLRLLNSRRGWDTEVTPLADAAWAIEEVRRRFGDLPVGLVGHSLGGRAALLGGERPGVQSVVALNPWLYGSEDPDLTGRDVLVVHGTRDRIASPRHAEQVVGRVRRRTDVQLRLVEGGKHAMLRHGSDFEAAAAGFTVRSLLGTQ